MVYRIIRRRAPQTLTVIIIIFLCFCFLYIITRKITPLANANNKSSFQNITILQTSKKSSEARTINEHMYPFLIPNTRKCSSANGTGDNVDVMFVIKSAVKNFKLRNVVRETWGLEDRFPEHVIHHVFNLGLVMDEPHIQQQVIDEYTQYGDIVQTAFIDSYFNNTIKIITAMRWAIEHCPNAKFVMFMDDDMYISVKNVIRFLGHPHEYPKYYQGRNVSDRNLPAIHNLSTAEINNTDFFAGFRADDDSPHRKKGSIWYVSEKEYPHKKYPPFILGGAYLMSSQTLRKMFFATERTKFFRFDDVYLGMVAKTAGIFPIHNKYFVNFIKVQNYSFVISEHLFGNSEKMLSLWKTQETQKNV